MLEKTAHCFEFGPFVLNPDSRSLTKDGVTVTLTTKTLETLSVLVQNRGKVMSKDELLAALWPDTVVEEANLTQSISTLRKILGDSPKDHRYIVTLPGRGYQFLHELACSSDLGPDGFELRSGESPGRSAGTRRDDHLWASGGFDDQIPWRDQACDFGVSELFE